MNPVLGSLWARCPDGGSVLPCRWIGWISPPKSLSRSRAGRSSLRARVRKRCACPFRRSLLRGAHSGTTAWARVRDLRLADRLLVDTWLGERSAGYCAVIGAWRHDPARRHERRSLRPYRHATVRSAPLPMVRLRVEVEVVPSSLRTTEIAIRPVGRRCRWWPNRYCEAAHNDRPRRGPHDLPGGERQNTTARATAPAPRLLDVASNHEQPDVLAGHSARRIVRIRCIAAAR